MAGRIRVNQNLGGIAGLRCCQLKARGVPEPQSQQAVAAVLPGLRGDEAESEQLQGSVRTCPVTAAKGVKALLAVSC